MFLQICYLKKGKKINCKVTRSIADDHYWTFQNIQMKSSNNVFILILSK